MEMRGAVFACAFFIAACLLLGCASDGKPSRPPASAQAINASFALPESPVAYTAKYIVNENGQESAKTVYRMGKSMRMDIGGAVSLFFVSGKVYSCPRIANDDRCFDITGNFDRQGLAPEFESLPKNAVPSESVDIGGTPGKCYAVPISTYASRKLCYTDRNVLAYDELRTGANSTRVEYATSINYGASAADFALPYQSALPPEN